MNDPFRNYDQWKTASPYDGEEDRDNSAVEEAFSDYASPYEVYRTTYKYTDCGPTVGFTFYGEWGAGDNGESGPASTYEPPCYRTIYCDDLRSLGSWQQLREMGLFISEICVSSIVEGVDQTTETHYIDCDPHTFSAEEIRKYFEKCVDRVNREADSIWRDTHGCETCAKHWAEECNTDTNPLTGDVMEGCDGVTVVWRDCPDCGGEGAS